MVKTMAKLRMAHASTHDARKPPGPKGAFPDSTWHEYLEWPCIGGNNLREPSRNLQVLSCGYHDYITFLISWLSCGYQDNITFVKSFRFLKCMLPS